MHGKPVGIRGLNMVMGSPTDPKVYERVTRLARIAAGHPATHRVLSGDLLGAQTTGLRGIGGAGRDGRRVDHVFFRRPFAASREGRDQDEDEGYSPDHAFPQNASIPLLASSSHTRAWFGASVTPFAELL